MSDRSYVVVDRLLWRAPLWPFAGSQRATCAPLERAAFALGRDLPSTAAGERAKERYRARARFRPTPHGLWAGVGIGRVAKKTAIASGTPRAHFTVRWANLARLGRVLLLRPEVRAEVRLALTPSLLVGPADVVWLPFVDGDDAVAEVAPRTVAREPIIDAVITALHAGASWPAARDALVEAVEGDANADAIDDLLLQLIDDGLVVHDLLPPLVGEPPLRWMVERLSSFDGIPEIDELRRVAAVIADGGDVIAQVGEAKTSLLATLVFDGKCDVERARVERAAQLLPQLLALQEALTPPASERVQATQAWRALDETHERFGAGSYDVSALALGQYGVATEAGLDEIAAPAPADPPLRAWLTARLFETVARGDDELVLAADELPAGDERPASAELFLTPGDGVPWLLGHHAPAAATLGRFADALGADGHGALAALGAAEKAAPPFDVAFAPSWSLADLGVHPPVPGRVHAVGLSTWGPTTRPLADFRVSVDSAGRWSWQSADGTVGWPARLSRVRSSTVEDGVYRLVAGWSLVRQHAPWSLSWPAAWAKTAAPLPRVRLDDFVVVPRSFAVPDLKSPADFKAWRRAYAVPRYVQLGGEDQLMVVDLSAPAALGTLTDLFTEEVTRIYEVWPPPDRLLDEDGRRCELVVSVVAAAAPPIVAARPVPPPSERAASSWQSWKLFGAPLRADRVLADLAPLLADPAVDRWFFVRYRDGARSHLRLRLGSDVDRTAQLHDRLADARASGDLITVESAEYFAEVGRYGDALSAVEQAFCLDSALTLADLNDDDSDPALALVCRWDALASALGVDGADRRTCALQLRTALAHLWLVEEDDLKRVYRAAQAELLTRLAQPSPRLVAYRDELARAHVPRALLVDLLHLAANRLAGTDPRWEARAAYLWQRALESLNRRR